MKTSKKAQTMNKSFVPVFGKTLAACALLFAMGAQAQTTPNSNTRTTTPQGEQRDGNTMDAPPPRSNDRVSGTTTDMDRSWQRFDERTGTDLGLDQDQMERLREVDTRYETEYRALGDDPRSNPGYDDVNTRRNNEVREILTTEQYERWSTRDNRNNAPTQGTGTGTGTGTTSPTPDR